ncbi:hypothetical protein ACJQWK_02572 [Exserohilum turcicum]
MGALPTSGCVAATAVVTGVWAASKLAKAPFGPAPGVTSIRWLYDGYTMAPLPATRPCFAAKTCKGVSAHDIVLFSLPSTWHSGACLAALLLLVGSLQLSPRYTLASILYPFHLPSKT